MNRKTFILLFSVLWIASFIIAACGGSQATPTSEESEPTPGEESTGGETTSGEKAKVVIFIGMGTGTDPDQITAQEALADEFNSSHNDIEVEFLIVPHDEAAERYLAMVSGGNAPQLVGPNGTSTISQFLDTWADTTSLLEKDAYDMSDFYGPVLQLNEFPGKNVGLPLGIYPSFIFYNKDLFDAAGLDYPTHDYNDTSWTIDKLREVAMQLTLDANGNNAASPDFDPENIVQWGYDDSWASGREAMAFWGGENIGRPTTDDYKTAVANSPEWIFGLQWISDGIWKDRFIPDLTGQEAYYAVGGDPFGGGLVAMFHSHTWFFPEGLVDLPFEYDIASVPFNSKGTRVATIHADNFTMPEAAENKEAAWEVMKWLTSPEHISDVCLIYGCIPARRSVESEFRTVLGSTWPALDLDVVFTAIDYLDYPQHESWVPEWGKIEDTMNFAMENIYSGENTDAQSVLDSANTEVQNILDEYWQNQ